MECIRGHCVCVECCGDGDCPDINCYDCFNCNCIYVSIISVTTWNNVNCACVGDRITFFANLYPTQKKGFRVQWYAPGAYYPTGTGSWFTTLWLTPGKKTVTATLCGSSKEKQVTIGDDCKLWDVGDEISGAITVESAKLCEQKTHTSSISDKDHWIKCRCLEETPSDSLTYSWSKTVGSNPESGMFIGNTNQPSVSWQAPPCVGTVIIKLTANYVPDPMDEPCSGSTRNDTPKDFEDTSTVSLPDGCEFAGAHDSSVHWTDLADYYSLTVPPWGQFEYWDATYEVDFKYNDCIWVCEISNVNAQTQILVRAPSPLPDMNSVSQASDVPCDEAELAKHDLDDTDLTDDEGAPRSKYWCHIAVMFHEQKHRADWQEFYGEELAIAIADSESFQSVIDCEDSNTTTCQAAENHWKYSILAQFVIAKFYAEDRFDDKSTPNVDEAEVRAYAVSYEWEQPISAALPEGCTP
jgi:hypothetical protein